MTWRDKLATLLLTALIAAAMLLTLLSFSRGLASLLLRQAAALSAPGGPGPPMTDEHLSHVLLLGYVVYLALLAALVAVVRVLG